MLKPLDWFGMMCLARSLRRSRDSTSVKLDYAAHRRLNFTMSTSCCMRRSWELNIKTNRILFVTVPRWRCFVRLCHVNTLGWSLLKILRLLTSKGACWRHSGAPSAAIYSLIDLMTSSTLKPGYVWKPTTGSILRAVVIRLYGFRNRWQSFLGSHWDNDRVRSRSCHSG